MSMELVLMEQRDKAREEVERLTIERDNASQEVEQLKWNYEQLSQKASARIKFLEEDHEKARAMFDQLTKERDEARDEVEQLKQALHDARLENSGQAALIEQLKEKVDQLQYIAEFDRKHFLKRPEPSRLEIAAMLQAGWLANPESEIDNQHDWWLAQADALIAAAKGGAK